MGISLSSGSHLGWTLIVLIRKKSWKLKRDSHYYQRGAGRKRRVPDAVVEEGAGI